MRLLVIGGTGFLGRHITKAALARRWSVTHFNRGLRTPKGMADVETRIGDRDRDLRPLTGGIWDVVVDTCAYRPRHVSDLASCLARLRPRYVLISSINQYGEFLWRGKQEADRPVGTADPEAALSPETYGPLKAACERACMEQWGKSALIVRPGYIVGPGDLSERFNYWSSRVAAGGPMLVPGLPQLSWQIIDARDLANWIVAMIAAGHGGVYNAVGPSQSSNVGEIMRGMIAAGAADARPIWVAPDFLAGASGGARLLDLAHWANLSAEWRGLYAVDNRAAVAAGLRFRPVAETMRDVLATLPAHGSGAGWAAGRNSDQALLEHWWDAQSRGADIWMNQAEATP